MSYTNGIFAKAARQVQHDDNDGIPINTQLAYGQKGEEFLQYCTSVFSSCGYSTQIVTEEKVFGFLFYQAYQTQRTRGRKKQQSQMQIFDGDDYHTVMAKYNSNHGAGAGASCELMVDDSSNNNKSTVERTATVEQFDSERIATVEQINIINSSINNVR
eukprot:jgi/Psemu1/21960/gm1.21960_g